MKIKLNQLMVSNAAGEPLLLVALGRVRKLPLPAYRAFEVSKLTRFLQEQATDLVAARNAVIERLGTPGPAGAVIEAGSDAMKLFIQEMQPLGEKEVDLPIAKKIPLPPDVLLSAEDLEMLSPVFEIETQG